VRIAYSGIFDVRINSTFEDLVIVRRRSGLSIGDSSNMDVKKCWNVSLNSDYAEAGLYQDKRYKDYASGLVSPKVDLPESSAA